MSTLSKLIIATFLSILTGQNESNLSYMSYTDYEPLPVVALPKESSTKEKALEVLTHKCNICHSKYNKRKVFTEDTMNDWSNAVYTQVFIKKRMPKGKKTKLTNQDYQDLLTWISSLKNKEYGN